MCGLAINIASFTHLLEKVNFAARMNHVTLMHIIKNKAEPGTTRIKRLLELLHYIHTHLICTIIRKKA